MDANLTTLFLVSLIAVAAPLVSELPIGLRLPIVVVEIGLGIVAGPHVLAWGTPRRQDCTSPDTRLDAVVPRLVSSRVAAVDGQK